MVSTTKITNDKQFYVFEIFNKKLREINLPFQQAIIRPHPLPNEYVFAPYPPNNNYGRFIYTTETQSLGDPKDIVYRNNVMTIEQLDSPNIKTLADPIHLINNYHNITTFLKKNNGRPYKLEVVKKSKTFNESLIETSSNSKYTKSDAKCYDYESSLKKLACSYYEKLKGGYQQFHIEDNVYRFGDLRSTLDYHKGTALVSRPDCVARLESSRYAEYLIFSNQITDVLGRDFDCSDGKECEEPFLVKLEFK